MANKKCMENKINSNGINLQLAYIQSALLNNSWPYTNYIVKALSKFAIALTSNQFFFKNIDPDEYKKRPKKGTSKKSS